MSWLQNMVYGAKAVDRAADAYAKNVAVGAVTEGIKAVNETAGNFAAAIFDIALGNPEDPRLDNPFFGQNGHEGASPKSNFYLTTVKYARMGSGITTSVADIGGVMSLAYSMTSGLMWMRISALFESMIPASRRAKPAVYSGWIFREMTQKAVLGGSLEAMVLAILKQKRMNTGGNAIKAGLTAATGGLTGFFINAGAQTLGPYFEYWMGQDIPALSQSLHWMAFRELVVGRGARGPGLRVLDLLWDELTIGRPALPSVADTVREPRGWLVVADLMS